MRSLHHLRVMQGLLFCNAKDTEMLGKGEDFDVLPESYIIFVCDHDPFGHGHPVYTIEHACREDEAVQVADDAHWIALNCKAHDKVQNRELRDFMEYLSDDRIDDVRRAAADPDHRRALLHEYGLDTSEHESI